jgi:anaerobic ribonucleoside-triphosphate reductase activating protein
VSGGEPFEQAEALAEVLRTVREETDLDILVYSGYRLDEIRQMGKSAQDLLALVDVLIDGRFERESPGTRLWRGSDNQRLHILTDRGRYFDEYRCAVYGPRRELMVGRTGDGRVGIIGIPKRDGGGA